MFFRNPAEQKCLLAKSYVSLFVHDGLLGEMELKYLNAVEFERLIVEDKFIESANIDSRNLLRFKNERSLLVKVPSSTNDKNPYDGFRWSRTKFDENRKVQYRHQPYYGKLNIFDAKVNCIRCTDYDNGDIHKQVVTYKDYTYCYYFAVGFSEINICDATNKRMDKATRDQLRNNIMPMRTVPNSFRIARGMGIHVTRKQVSNLARNTSDVILQKTGPRSKTSLKMAEDLKQMYPASVWFEHDSFNVLTDFTFVQVFQEGCNMFKKGCPSKQAFDDWLHFVDFLELSDEETRKREIRAKLQRAPNGVFFSSRLHVDTTFGLGDVYVTFVLGETANFKTKSSRKPRVVPLGYMLHSSKRSENHEKFAYALKAELEEVYDTTERSIPCVLLDGECALEHYPEVLETRAVRCDLHILSLLSFEHGGKRAALQAKPYIFGKMKGGKWRTGLLGCFDGQTFDRRLRHIEKLVHPKIVRWLKTNKRMLMECASALSKLRAGHILQFSTNNQNETFNGIIKSRISRQQSLPDLIKKLDDICHEKLRECWLSGIDGSEQVYFVTDVEEDCLEDRIAAYSSAGLISTRTLALKVPLSLAEGFNLQKLNCEELAVDHLRCTRRQGSIFHLENTSLPDDDRNRFSQVQISGDSRLECWQCNNTLPEFVCRHIIFCLCLLQPDEVDSYWMSVQPVKPTLPPVNSFATKSGLKKSDRIGSGRSARNHIRQINNISSISYGTASPSTPAPVSHSPSMSINTVSTPDTSVTVLATASSGSLHSSQNSPFTPDSSSSSISSVRRSVRKKKRSTIFSPSHDSSLGSDFY